MKLILYVDGKPFRDWPIDMPADDSNLNSLQNFEARERFIQDMICEKQIYHANCLTMTNHHFQLHAVSRFPEEDYEEVDLEKDLKGKVVALNHQHRLYASK